MTEDTVTIKGIVPTASVRAVEKLLVDAILVEAEHVTTIRERSSAYGNALIIFHRMIEESVERAGRLDLLTPTVKVKL